MIEPAGRFYDINRMPKQPGLLLFGISLSRISTSQSPEQCFAFMEHFVHKIHLPEVGLNFIYGDGLYLNSPERAFELKKKFEPLIHQHKYGFRNLLAKHPLYVQRSFGYVPWSDMILGCKEFFSYLSELRRRYERDPELQAVVRKDVGVDEPSPEQVSFVLEEVLMFYLAAKGKVELRNDFVEGRHTWVLWCYPGTPLYTEIYLFKENVFALDNPTNVFQNCFYDLSARLLYKHDLIDRAELFA